MKKYILIITTIFGVFTAALTALGADKYIMPVLQFQHVELASKVEKLEGVMKMQELYNKKVQLHKLEKEIKELNEVPQGLLDYKKYLENEIHNILNVENA